MSDSTPKSIQTSMNDVVIKDLICLEAGTGAGNMTLAKRGAKLIYSVSNNQEHLDFARSKLSDSEAKRVEFINADLCDLTFLSEGTIDLITAHMLVSVVPPVELHSILWELTRVAKKDSSIIINDYNPLSSYQMERSYLVEKLFRIENALNYLVKGKPALVWYPSEYIVDLLQPLGWKAESVRLLYQKVPWPKELLEEHIDVIKECAEINGKEIFLQQALETFNEIDDNEVVYAGSIYSIKMRKAPEVKRCRMKMKR